MNINEIRESLCAAVALSQETERQVKINQPGLGSFCITNNRVKLRDVLGKTRFITPTNLEGHVYSLALRLAWQPSLIFAQ